jgi:DNA-binding transcriptional ArsR family regulator
MSMPSPDTLTAFLDVAHTALSHPGRRGILEALAEAGSLRAEQIAAYFPHAQARAVRFHLAALRKAGLVTARRNAKTQSARNEAARVDRLLTTLTSGRADGREVYYELCRPALAVVLQGMTDLLRQESRDGISRKSR